MVSVPVYSVDRQNWCNSFSWRIFLWWSRHSCLLRMASDGPSCPSEPFEFAQWGRNAPHSQTRTDKNVCPTSRIRQDIALHPRKTTNIIFLANGNRCHL